MKKILVAIALLFALMLTLTLPIVADTDTDTDGESISDVATGEADETAQLSDQTTSDSADATESVSEIESDTAPQTSFSFRPETLSETLPIMGMGMLGIFLVIGTIALVVVILSKLPAKKDED